MRLGVQGLVEGSATCLFLLSDLLLAWCLLSLVLPSYPWGQEGCSSWRTVGRTHHQFSACLPTSACPAPAHLRADLACYPKPLQAESWGGGAAPAPVVQRRPHCGLRQSLSCSGLRHPWCLVPVHLPSELSDRTTGSGCLEQMQCLPLHPPPPPRLQPITVPSFLIWELPPQLVCPSHCPWCPWGPSMMEDRGSPS